ncbi:hypothetical protein, partial [Sphingobacterium thalpophilum]|uniref:hypothetical protein n=1 Tax=Sphingobacterium thalpophilum TaxID=259 RepID=UPI0031D2CDC6
KHFNSGRPNVSSFYRNNKQIVKALDCETFSIHKIKQATGIEEQKNKCFRFQGISCIFDYRFRIQQIKVYV